MCLCVWVWVYLCSSGSELCPSNHNCKKRTRRWCCSASARGCLLLKNLMLHKCTDQLLQLVFVALLPYQQYWGLRVQILVLKQTGTLQLKLSLWLTCTNVSCLFKLLVLFKPPPVCVCAWVCEPRWADPLQPDISQRTCKQWIIQAFKRALPLGSYRCQENLTFYFKIPPNIANEFIAAVTD